MEVVVGVENIIVAIFCAGVISFAAFAPLIFALKSTFKKLEEGQQDDGTFILIRFAGIFFIFQAAALSIAIFLTFAVNIILAHDPSGGLDAAFRIFWTITPGQVTAYELQSLAFFIAALRGGFTLICSLLPLVVVVLALFFIQKNITAAAARMQDASAPGIDAFMVGFKSSITTVLLFIIFIGWSMMVAVVVNHPQGLTPYQIGQNWWRETAGLDTATPTHTINGMSPADALRKGMYF
jgi:hypothetical protein